MSLHKRAHRAWFRVAKEVIPSWFGPDCCVGASAIGLDALAHFGVKAQPVAYQLLAFNAAYILRATREGRHSSSPEETGTWWEEEGAWCLGLGVPDTPRAEGKWPGHLAIWSRGWLLDFTAPQASRRDRKLLIPPLHLQVGAFREVVTLGREGAALELTPRWEDQSFRELPDWALNRPRFHRDILPDVLKRMRKLM